MRHSLTVIPETDTREGSEVGCGVGPTGFSWRLETDVGKQLISRGLTWERDLLISGPLGSAAAVADELSPIFSRFFYIGTNIQHDAILLGAVFRLFVLSGRPVSFRDSTY